MDGKILAHIYAPAAAMRYEMWLPLNMEVNVVASMVGKAINTLSNGLYSLDDVPVLFNQDTGKFLDASGTVYDSGIGNSCNLILI